MFSVSREGPDLGIFGGKRKRGRYEQSNLGANYDSANNTEERYRYRCYIRVPRKQAKSLKNTSELVHP